MFPGIKLKFNSNTITKIKPSYFPFQIWNINIGIQIKQPLNNFANLSCVTKYSIQHSGYTNTKYSFWNPGYNIYLPQMLHHTAFTTLIFVTTKQIAKLLLFFLFLIYTAITHFLRHFCVSIQNTPSKYLHTEIL